MKGCELICFNDCLHNQGNGQRWLSLFMSCWMMMMTVMMIIVDDAIVSQYFCTGPIRENEYN